MVKAIPAVKRARAAVDAIKADIQLGLMVLNFQGPANEKEQYDATRRMLPSKPVEQRQEIVRQNRTVPDFARAIALMPNTSAALATKLIEICGTKCWNASTAKRSPSFVIWLSRCRR